MKLGDPDTAFIHSPHEFPEEGGGASSGSNTQTYQSFAEHPNWFLDAADIRGTAHASLTADSSASSQVVPTDEAAQRAEQASLVTPPAVRRSTQEFLVPVPSLFNAATLQVVDLAEGVRQGYVELKFQVSAEQARGLAMWNTELRCMREVSRVESSFE